MNPSRHARAAGIATDANAQETEIARLLSQRFGDGLIYIAEEADHEILRRAMANGLVSTDGHLTAAGYRTLRRSAPD